MANWALKEPHYLKVQGIEWEYRETDQQTQRQVRRVFPVPLHLDPQNPSDFTHKEDGIIVVSDGSKPMPRALIFDGPPTPSMEPLDDEARAISDEWAPKWIHPIESLPGQGFSQSLLLELERQIQAKAAEGSSTPAYAKGIDPEAFNKLQEQVQELMKQNTMLMQELVASRTSPDPERRA